MLLQTNSYVVPKEKRAEHTRLLRRFRQTLARLGCDQFDVYEQVPANWKTGETTGRYIQMMRFRDRKHQQAVQVAEKQDAGAQQVIAEFCQLINFPYQQQEGLFAVGYYQSAVPIAPPRSTADPESGEGFVDASAAEGDADPEAQLGMRIVGDEPVSDEPDAPAENSANGDEASAAQ